MNSFWVKYWYLFPLCLLSCVCLFAIVKSVPNVRRFSERKYFKIIFLFFLLTFFQLITGIAEEFIFDTSNKIVGKKSPTNISAFIYIICEYQVYVYLLLNFIKSQPVKSYLRSSRICVFLLAIILWASKINMVQLMSYYTLTEAVLLLPACFYFFYEILTGPPLLKLNKEPSFWIVTGITFLFVCLMPAYIGIAIIQSFRPIAIMDYIAYSILIFLLLKGITCKTVQVA